MFIDDDETQASPSRSRPRRRPAGLSSRHSTRDTLFVLYASRATTLCKPGRPRHRHGSRLSEIGARSARRQLQLQRRSHTMPITNKAAECNQFSRLDAGRAAGQGGSDVGCGSPIDGKLVPGLRSALAGGVWLTAARHKVCAACAIQLMKMPLARFGPLLFVRDEEEEARGYCSSRQVSAETVSRAAPCQPHSSTWPVSQIGPAHRRHRPQSGRPLIEPSAG
jgi:hypothetical protein